MFDIPPSMMLRRLKFLPVGDVLTADVMENLQPPEDAASNPDAYYRHLAEMFQRLEPDPSVGGIAAAQATADRLWRVLHPLKRPRRKATVGEKVAAARWVRHSDPPAAAPATETPAAPADPRRRKELVDAILRHLDEAARRRSVDAAVALDVTAGNGRSEEPGPDGSAEVTGEPTPLGVMSEPAAREPTAAQDSGPDDITPPLSQREADDVTPVPGGPYAEQVEAPPATMAEFIARGDHGPRGHWVEPRWTDDIKAALRPPPLEAGESLTQYLQMFACYTDPRKLSSLREWQVNQDFTDSKWREVRREGRAAAPNMEIFERA